MSKSVNYRYMYIKNNQLTVPYVLYPSIRIGYSIHGHSI